MSEGIKLNSEGRKSNFSNQWIHIQMIFIWTFALFNILISWIDDFFSSGKKTPLPFNKKKNLGKKIFTGNTEEGIIISILRTVTEQSRITETRIHYSYVAVWQDDKNFNSPVLWFWKDCREKILKKSQVYSDNFFLAEFILPVFANRLKKY